METQKKHLDYIDLVKGVGIILVVWGHTYQACPIRSYIYSFHMPLFVFVSGILYKDYAFDKQLLHKLNRLVIPFIFFSLLSWVIYLTIILAHPTHWSLLGAQLKKLIYIAAGSGQNGVMLNGEQGNIVLWFLPCLFFISVIYDLMKKFLHNQVVFIITIILFSILGLLCDRFDWNLPYSLDATAIMLPFYFMGNYVKDRKLSIYMLPVFFILGYICYYYNLKLSGGIVDTSNGIMGNYFLFYVGALMSIFFILNLCYKLKSIYLLNYLGKKSLIIMVYHLMILQLLIYIASKFTDINNTLFGIITTILTLVLCVPLIKLTETYLPNMLGQKPLIKSLSFWPLKKKLSFKIRD
jgi:fucose 4-O-acetylase-like acetyltransferase